MASIQLSIPSTSEHKEADENEKTFTTYNILVQWNDGRQKVIHRRFHEFREFDKVWSEFYPTVAERVKLPPQHSFIQTKGTIEKRRKKLEEYLIELAQVRAIQPLLAQFIGVPELDITGPKGPRQADLPDMPIEKWRGMEDAAAHIHGLKREEKRAEDAEKHGMLAVEENGETYFVPANTFGQVLDTNNLTLATKLTKGNTHAASERAKREKEEFLRKNAGIIASLLPGRQLNVVYNVDRTGEFNDRYLGRLQMSLWFRPGTGGDLRPAYTDDDAIDDMGGGAIIIEIHSGMDLPSYDGITNPYVKLFLLPDTERKSKQKTTSKFRTINPTWEEVFEYRNIYPSELGGHSLSLSVWDRRNSGKNVCLGEVLCTELSTLPTTPQTKLSQWIDLRPFSNLILDATTSPRAVTISSMHSGGGAPAATTRPALPSSPPPSLPRGPPPKLKSRPMSSTSSTTSTPSGTPSQAPRIPELTPTPIIPQRSTPAPPATTTAKPTSFFPQPQAAPRPAPKPIPNTQNKVLLETTRPPEFSPPPTTNKPLPTPGLQNNTSSGPPPIASGPAPTPAPRETPASPPVVPRSTGPSPGANPFAAAIASAAASRQANNPTSTSSSPAPPVPPAKPTVSSSPTPAPQSNPFAAPSAAAHQGGSIPPPAPKRPTSSISSAPAPPIPPAKPTTESSTSPPPQPQGTNPFAAAVASAAAARQGASAPTPAPKPTPAAAPSPSPAPPPRPKPARNTCIVTSTFEPDPAEAAQNSLMALNVGEIITLIDGTDDAWWFGRIGNREGYFPKSFVEKQ